ncbi:MAG: energy-coupling factor ABC transporter permease [Acidobacteria bacterium]|nr:energy-coupling factor ABC transporter permease [Acidobacteriota bacterium]
MHIPDGFLSAPVWAGLAVASAPSVGLLAKRAQAGLEETRAPLMGVMGAFVFAAQMINFPVGLGTSGHLVGSTLLAVTLGPAAAAVVMTAILTIQALVFQDGGLLALGANVFNMAVAGVFAGYWPYRLLAGTRGRNVGVFAGGFLSVLVAACLCLGELAVSAVKVPASMLGLSLAVFTVTGALEGVITVAVIGAVERINPRWIKAPGEQGRPALALLGLVAVVLVSVGFLMASALPDGLERTLGLGGERAAAGSWLKEAGAGLAGLGVTFLLCYAAPATQAGRAHQARGMPGAAGHHQRMGRRVAAVRSGRCAGAGGPDSHVWPGGASVACIAVHPGVRRHDGLERRLDSRVEPALEELSLCAMGGSADGHHALGAGAESRRAVGRSRSCAGGDGLHLALPGRDRRPSRAPEDGGAGPGRGEALRHLRVQPGGAVCQLPCQGGAGAPRHAGARCGRAAGMSCVVNSKGLRYRYDSGFEALRGVDFRLHRGENVAVLGPNGSGKTTFLLHLNGILRGEGELKVCDLPVDEKHLTTIRRHVGFLFQDPEDQLFLPTILEDVAFGPAQAGLSKAEAEARAAEVLAQVGVVDGWERAPYHLSGGEKQRVALAGILAVRPEVLMLDEPTTHLDPPGRRKLIDLLKTLPQAKLVVTHDTAFARALCERAVFFDAGRIVADAPVTEVVERYGWGL